MLVEGNKRQKKYMTLRANGASPLITTVNLAVRDTIDVFLRKLFRVAFIC